MKAERTYFIWEFAQASTIFFPQTCSECDFLLVSYYSLKDEFKTKERPPKQKELPKLLYYAIDNWEK